MSRLSSPLTFTRRLCALVALATSAAWFGTARGDVYELEGGGEVRGSLVERGPNGAYVVQTEDGVQIALPRKHITRIVQVDDTLAKYQRMARTIPDTADGQRTLARWCKERGLADEATVHWERLLVLAPDDEEARIGLDYQKMGGRWLTREELMARRGMVFYEGKYRTPQDVALRRRSAAFENSSADWVRTLRLWLGWLDSRREEQAIEARANLEALDDPAATTAVVQVLDDVTDPWVYGELLRVLGRLDHPDAVRKLVDVSLYDSSVDLRELALDLLTRNGRRVPILPYVRALKNADNKVVNRAGKALALIGDPEAVSPLIDALTTEHKYKVETGNPGGINAGMVNGSGGFSMGGDGPKIITKALDNPAVLQALTKLTGEHNLEYDESAWRSWFVNQQERALSSARRDK